MSHARPLGRAAVAGSALAGPMEANRAGRIGLEAARGPRMLLGAFVRREWVTSIRSGRLFAHRRGAALMLALFIGVTFLAWDWRGMDRASVRGAARFGDWLFGITMLAEAALSFQVLSRLAPSIAAERDRKSLDALLATRFTSAEIVLGNLAEGLVRYLNSLAATLPVVVLVVALGGTDRTLVLMAFACLGSMTFSLAAFAVAISAGSKTAARASSVAVGCYAAWLTVPWLVLVLKPILWPGGPNWPVAACLRLLDGSPMGLWLNLMGVIPRPGGPVAAVARMVAWQVAAGLVLIAWAIARLRPASRAVYDLEGRTSRLRSVRLALRRPYPRPPCGDDPVLWNDLYALRGPSRPGRLAGRVFGLALLVPLVVAVSWFAGPAFAELRERGYSASSEAFEKPEFSPFVRVVVSKMVIKSNIPPRPGQARLEFNIALRQFSAMIAWFYAMSILGAVSRGVLAERRRDTWLGLIATPLSGREILGAKMLAGFLNARETAYLLVGLWAVGLAAGALHPLGFLAGSIALIVIGGWSASLGLATLGGYQFAEPNFPGPGTFRTLVGIGVGLLAMTVPLLLTDMALFSFEEVRAATRGGPISAVAGSFLGGWVGPRGIMVAWLASSTAMVMLAVRIARSVFRGFDAKIGRPTRTGSPEGPRSSRLVPSIRGAQPG